MNSLMSFLVLISVLIVPAAVFNLFEDMVVVEEDIGACLSIMSVRRAEVRKGLRTGRPYKALSFKSDAPFCFPGQHKPDSLLCNGWGRLVSKRTSKLTACTDVK